jgi:hypothetical protein
MPVIVPQQMLSYPHIWKHGGKMQVLCVTSFVILTIDCVGSSHMVVWQPRTRRWSRHTDVAGSSDAKPKKEATRQWDNSIHRMQFRVHCVPTNNQCKTIC